MATGVIPKEFKYEYKPIAVPAATRTLKFNSTQAEEFGPNTEVRINVDTGNPGSFWKPTATRLFFTLNIYNSNPYADYTDFGKAGVKWVIDEFMTYSNASIVERLSNYGQHCEKMCIASGQNSKETEVYRQANVPLNVAEGDPTHLNFIKPAMVDRNGAPMYALRMFSDDLNIASRTTFGPYKPASVYRYNDDFTTYFDEGNPVETSAGAPKGFHKNYHGYLDIGQHDIGNMWGWKPAGATGEWGCVNLQYYPWANTYNFKDEANSGYYPSHSHLPDEEGGQADYLLQKADALAVHMMPIRYTKALWNCARFFSGLSMTPPDLAFAYRGKYLVENGQHYEKSNDMINFQFPDELAETHTEVNLRTAGSGTQVFYPRDNAAYNQDPSVFVQVEPCGVRTAKHAGQLPYVVNQQGDINFFMEDLVDISSDGPKKARTAGGIRYAVPYTTDIFIPLNCKPEYLASHGNIPTQAMWPFCQPIIATESCESGWTRDLDAQMSLANVKNFPIGIPPETNNLAEYLRGSSIEYSPGKHKFSINCCIDLESSLLGRNASGYFPAGILDPQGMYLSFRTALKQRLFCLSNDPCRVIPRTPRSFVPNSGRAHGAIRGATQVTFVDADQTFPKQIPFLLGVDPGNALQITLCNLDKDIITSKGRHAFRENPTPNVPDDYITPFSTSFGKAHLQHFTAIFNDNAAKGQYPVFVTSSQQVEKIYPSDGISWVDPKLGPKGSTLEEQNEPYIKEYDRYQPAISGTTDSANQAALHYNPQVHRDRFQSSLLYTTVGTGTGDQMVYHHGQNRYDGTGDPNNPNEQVLKNYANLNRYRELVTAGTNGAIPCGVLPFGDPNDGYNKMTGFAMPGWHGAYTSSPINGFPLAKYIPQLKPWTRKEKTSIVEFCSEATAVFYGTYLYKGSVAQSRRTVYPSFNKSQQRELTMNYYGYSTDYTINNVYLEVEETLFPDTVAKNILDTALRQEMINMYATHYVSTNAITPVAQSLDFQVNLNCASAYYAMWTFQSDAQLNGDEAMAQPSFSFPNPLMRLQYSHVDDRPSPYLAGQTYDVGGKYSLTNFCNPSAQNSLNIQMRNSSDWYPSIPITNWLELLRVTALGLNALDDVYWKANMKAPITLASITEKSTNQVTNHAYNVYAFEKEGYTVPFTPLEALDDQACISNPFWNYAEMQSGKKIRGRRCPGMWGTEAEFGTKNGSSPSSKSDWTTYPDYFETSQMDIYGVLNKFKPPVGTFFLCINLCTFPGSAASIRSGMTIKNSLLGLRMDPFPMGTHTASGGTNPGTIIQCEALCDIRWVIQNGGYLEAYY